MRFRKLRIAWSVFWAVGFVLLIALWVRSYSVRYLMTGSDSYGYHIALGSNKGYVYLVRHKSPTGPTTASYFAYGSGPSGDFMMPLGWTVGPGWIKVVIPYFCLIPATVGAASLPWLRRRFSLRTLLIATTLLAVVLGLAVCVASK